jgi:CRP/FNR family transcriptional regulator
MAIQPDSALLLQQLRSIAFLKALDQPTLEALAHDAGWRAYAAGEVVFIEGESNSGLYVLHSGWVKVLKTLPEGREQVLRFIGPGETFNEIGVLADRPNPVTAIALEASGVWLLRTRLLRHS